MVGLYAHGTWQFTGERRRDGYSLALFGPHGREYRHPPAELVTAVRLMPHVTSVQITFHENRLAVAHAMPPGGFRLAVINSLDLDAGRAARQALAAAFSLDRALAAAGGWS